MIIRAQKCMVMMVLRLRINKMVPIFVKFRTATLER